MNRIARLVAIVVVLIGAARAVGAQQTFELIRRHQKAVLVTAYAPSDIANCRGVAVISPGAGGSENGYRYLGEAMSSFGYLSVVVGHQESGRSALRNRARSGGLRGGLAELITEPEAYQARLLDIAAAKHWAQGQCKEGETVLIGHSMGAATVMMEAGAGNKLGIGGADAFNAYIALSPQGPGSIFPENAWSGIRRPVLMLTGTRDTELGGASWETRKEPFGNMPPGCKWFGVVDGASHLNFAGVGLSHATEALTTQTIGAFLNGVRRGDCSPPERERGMDLTTK